VESLDGVSCSFVSQGEQEWYYRGFALGLYRGRGTKYYSGIRCRGLWQGFFLGVLSKLREVPYFSLDYCQEGWINLATALYLPVDILAMSGCRRRSVSSF
jgi:hypothetical protein